MSSPWMKTTSEGTDRGRGGRARLQAARAKTRGKSINGEFSRSAGQAGGGTLSTFSPHVVFGGQDFFLDRLLILFVFALLIAWFSRVCV